jgi:hypothetical protein
MHTQGDEGYEEAERHQFSLGLRRCCIRSRWISYASTPALQMATNSSKASLWQDGWTHEATTSRIA